MEVVAEPVAMLSTPEFNYFHWLHDVLPKIHLLATTGRGDVKLYLNIVNDLQWETLRLLRIQPERVFNSADHEFLAASELVIPNFVGRVGACRVLEAQWRGLSQEITMGNVDALVNVAMWTCTFLRESFLSQVTSTTPNSLRIYVSRRDASKKRGIKAEEEFSELIQGYGFKTIVLTGMKFVDQVDIFRSADVVLAPHGAGLANLAFCAPGTKCLELFSPTYVSDLYAVLSQIVGAQYFYLVGAGRREWKTRRSNEEFELDLRELEELFELAGLQSSSDEGTRARPPSRPGRRCRW
jgi:capsular polysaccharide biosynthesis protein